MQNIGANAVGKSFFVYKYKNFDLSLPRSENKIGLKHNDFEVKLINDEFKACQRRDFTINSIMLNIFTFEILDFYGGISDIKSKTLRFINEKTFCEDSLRSLRAVQFAARFGFKIENQTKELIKSMDISHLSSSRISTELIKFFKSSN
jgi:tRNA nucleotidyltransferase (CCA-adding enzyme)